MRRWLLLLALAAGAAGCGDDGSPGTGAVVTVDAEPAVIESLSAIAVRIEGSSPDGSDATDERRLFRPPDDSLPLQIGVVPKDGDARRVFRVTAAALDAEEQVIARATVASSYAEGRVVWFHIRLEAACSADVSCPADDGPQTCCGGECVSAVRAPDMAPEWSPGNRPPPRARLCGAPVGDGGLDAGPDGGSDAGMLPASPPARIAAAHTAFAAHACAVLESGQLVCWGRNMYGQLGDGTSIERKRPVLVEGLPGEVAQVALGTEHTCVRGSGGSVSCFGRNDRGQLGDGASGAATSTEPIAVDGVDGASALTAGNQHNCAVVGGQGYCWGNNDQGQLGNGETSLSPEPSPVLVADIMGLRSVCAGDRFSCAQTGSGDVLCWGVNNKGQLGRGGRASPGPLPERVQLPTELDATQITCGSGHACALMNDDRIFCWGANGSGQIGDGTSGSMEHRPTPVAVTSLSGREIDQITAGDSHTCARSTTGALLCWGANLRGQLGAEGLMATEPVAVDTERSGSWVAAGAQFSCGVLEGEAFCWGANGQGQLGDATSSDSRQPSRVALP